MIFKLFIKIILHTIKEIALNLFLQQIYLFFGLWHIFFKQAPVESHNIHLKEELKYFLCSY